MTAEPEKLASYLNAEWFERQLSVGPFRSLLVGKTAKGIAAHLAGSVAQAAMELERGVKP